MFLLFIASFFRTSDDLTDSESETESSSEDDSISIRGKERKHKDLSRKAGKC